MTDKQIPKTPKRNDEIDLLALAGKIWSGKKTILLSVAVAGCIGVFIAVLSPKEYIATTTVVPQMGQSGNKLGGLSSLAAMAGFNIDLTSGSENISPLVYPKIINSPQFQLDLMNVPFTFAKIPKPTSLYDYYTTYYKPGFFEIVTKYTIGLPGVILSGLRGNSAKPLQAANGQEGLIQFSTEQEKIRKLVSSKISVLPDAKNGYITVSAAFSEPLLTAQVAQQTREQLQAYITQIKVEKSQSRLDFIQKQYEEKKQEYEKAQIQLARFRDQNKFMATSIAKTTEERLQGEYTIAMNVYNELAKQLEQAKIQVKEQTPVFSVIDPVMVPAEKSKPQKMKILGIWIFLGAVVGIGIIFGREYIKTIRRKLKEQTPE